jgi:class 3 adenylate cyclase
MVETLVLGRESMRQRAWDEALQSFTKADQEGSLSPQDLELMADAAWWSGHPDESVEAFERAFARYSEEGMASKAAFVGLRLSYLAFRRMAIPIATGWLARAERMLLTEPESAVHAWVKLLQMIVLLMSGDVNGGVDYADQTIALARKHHTSDVESLALSFKGQALIRMGQWREGLAMIDEATATAMSGELDLRAASDVYCITIDACRSLTDYQRAWEWTQEADRWMRRYSVGGYAGVCRVHRAELKRLHGSWPEAEQEARNACEELERFRMLDGVGFAHYEVGEVRLHMGDLDGAEEAFSRAYEYGHDSQPGRALLLLAKGEADEAAQSIARSLSADPDLNADEPGPSDLLGRMRILPAQVEIALVRGDLETARTATAELEKIAGEFSRPALEAEGLTARGALLLHEGDTSGAVRDLAKAWRMWQGIDLPYETAKARMLLGQAYVAAGDAAAGRLELRAARSTLQRLGAALDLRRVDELLGDDETSSGKGRRVTKTFMFTDIVTSTDLVTAIGDAAWEDLLHWHDRALRSAFANHAGQVVRHTGDGFFVTFDRARDAVECAVAIQRRLADHRREHGFAPFVRIGLHDAEATREGNDYSGQGVHAAARVGALADKEEILISSVVLKDAGEIRFPVSEARSVNLKGIPEPLEVHAIDWR